ncbi:MAG: hypothetical protein E5X45_28595 [Mesorhizobium sp.]|nr:hypothetical protein EOD29_11135 [Mesorhizobium sp. M1A.T.Ca.IN.004.03.1.1]RWK88268.1 MAG: hypothetical protein EOR52_14675 [Mesorhizobium sp.]TIP17727.1 MAG: hypothetical protein E5X66_20080 [Mesorhizobium sp.]TJV77148.1 MAG: hypothetical protein E5X45_28595 [Mesorhizobium sp.]
MADLKAFTRDLMGQMEKDLGTKLDWIAADHWNTDNPHIHIILRGRTEDGEDLVRARRKLVSTLVRDAGLAAPDAFSGDVVEALEKAGLFRLRAVLVGTVAFQTYAGHLGVKLPGAALQTGDADFAQFHSVSAEVDDSMPPLIEVLKAVDPTFRVIPHRTDAGRTTQFENASRYRIEFLTPNRGSDEHADHASPMPSLGGASAQPLRFLDFLIRDPVRAVLLHRSGVPVLVPSPERFAVHKLIVAARGERSAAAKREKDLHQAGLLVKALETTRRRDDLAHAFAEAWNRGEAWREALRKGLQLLQPDRREMVDLVLGRALDEARIELDGFMRRSR